MYRIEIKYDNGDYVNEVLEKQIDIQSKYGITDRAFRRSRDENRFIRSEILKCAYKGSEVSEENKVGKLECKVDFSDLVKTIENMTAKYIEPVFKKRNRPLVIPDIHAPFTKKGYLKFCKAIYDKYECTHVIFLGDLIDMHFSSYHSTDPDGYSAGRELDLAKKEIKDWYETFPDAKITLGNHDRLALRKAFDSGISKHWVKDIKEVLNTPNWEFKEYFIENDILFYHGEGQSPTTKAQQEMISVVCGHNHSKSGITFYQSRLGKRIFAMQLGTGIDQDAYAFAYNKHGRPSHVNCGVIIDGTPIIEYMEV